MKSAHTIEHKDLFLSKRACGKRIIESKIGVSKESPNFFKTSYGLVSQDTYDNPYISPRNITTNQGPLKNRQTFNIFSNLNEQLAKEVFHIQHIKTIPYYK